MTRKEKTQLKRLVYLAHVVAFAFGLINAGFTGYEHIKRLKAEAHQNFVNTNTYGAMEDLLQLEQLQSKGNQQEALPLEKDRNHL